MLVKPLALQGPVAGFNGGVIVDPGMTVLEQRLIPEGLVLPIDGLMRSFGLMCGYTAARTGTSPTQTALM